MSFPNRIRHTFRNKASVCVAALLVSFSTSGNAQQEDPGPPQAEERVEPTAGEPDVPPKRSATTDTPVVATPNDAGGNRLSMPRPLAEFAKSIKKRIADYGWIVNVDSGFYDQYASSILTGQKNLGTYAFSVWADWNFATIEGNAKFSFEVTLLGSPGLNYDTATDQLTRNIGSISNFNAELYPNSAAIDEFAIKIVSDSNAYVGLFGRIDLSNRFDTNRVANNGFYQFFSFALQNNLSIPWSIYGGAGGLLRYNHGDQLYAMVAGSESDSDEAFKFWKTATEGNWYEMAELGLVFDVPHLGVGHYRLTPWHSRLDGEDGWGFGINFDQEVGRSDLVAFFRFGLGDPDVTPVKTFASAGLGWFAPFGRKHDMAGIGFAWSDPSPGEGDREETLLEVFYRFAIRPWIQISPDLQVVIHPSTNLKTRVVYVPGIRLTASF